MRFTIVMFLCLVSGLGFSQPSEDSLRSVWNDPSQPDTVRYQAMKDLMWNVYLFNRPDTACTIAEDMERFAREKELPVLAGDALNLQGISFAVRGNSVEAIDRYKNALEIFQEHGVDEKISSVSNNIGILYTEQGNYRMAIDFSMKSLKIAEEIGDQQEIAGGYLNVGRLFVYAEEYENARSYFLKAMQIQESLNDSMSLPISYNHMGSLHNNLENLDSAFYYYQKALRLARNNPHSRHITTVYENLARYYVKTNQIDTALALLNAALPYALEANDVKSIVSLKGQQAQVYEMMGECDKVIQIGEEAIDLAKKMRANRKIVPVAASVSACYLERGNTRKALEYYELHVACADSVENDENRQEVMRQQFQYDYEKKAFEDSLWTAKEAELKDQEIARQEAEIDAKRKQQILLYRGLGLTVLFAFFIFNRFRVTNKQKKIIERQKSEVEKQREIADRERVEAEEQKSILEEKNKEILDSINYAKRLQNAILPAPKVVKEYLGESFILYKPKDIVAGDFYWLEVHDGWSYIAAADCTGHGVPGAMVSVVCSNALSKALIEECITDTGKLLDRTRELVIERFGKSDSEIKDGMDISLAAIRYDGKQVRWSGANNPLWLLKGDRSPLDPPKGEQAGSAYDDPTNRGQRSEGKDSNSDWDSNSALIEIKADKQPIGKYAHSRPFTQHTIDIEPGDTLYMFSDGYIDQFGGPKGKKYKSAKFKDLLLSIRDKPMDEQKRIIDRAFEEWRGDLEQIDDVCVVGVKL